MVDFATIESCSDLTSDHAKRAASSSAELRSFLARMTEIARPDEGCPKILMAIARLVGQSWIEGDLRVELTGDDDHTLLTIICEYGMGIRERLIPASKFNGVPLDEFSRALHLAPALALPLRVNEEDDRIVLAPLLTPEERLKSVAPPSFEMEDRSLGEKEKKTSPPGPPAPNPHEHPTPPRGFDAVAAEPKVDEGWDDIPIEPRAKSNAPETSEPEPFGALPIPSEPSAFTVVGSEPPPKAHSDQPPTPRASVDWPREPSAFTSVPPDAPIPDLEAELAPGLDASAPLDELIEVKDDEEIGGIGALSDTFDPVDPPPQRRPPSGIRSPGDAPAEEPKVPTIHTRPTVRRMVAIDVAVVQKRDPRREED
ncbi:MAG: hypothetical protein JST00_40135 [Deltaproteobacteria bacterium]|nr:hypothetical protein [Deltaproteobacteria bacterium]